MNKTMASVTIQDGETLFYRRRTLDANSPFIHAIYLFGTRQKERPPHIIVVDQYGKVSEFSEFFGLAVREPDWFPFEQV